jgi:hypothetical protein
MKNNTARLCYAVIVHEFYFDQLSIMGWSCVRVDVCYMPTRGGSPAFSDVGPDLRKTCTSGSNMVNITRRTPTSPAYDSPKEALGPEIFARAIRRAAPMLDI